MQTLRVSSMTPSSLAVRLTWLITLSTQRNRWTMRRRRHPMKQVSYLKILG